MRPPGPSPAERLAARIATEGPLPFSIFMDDALYGPGGFYTDGGGAGRSRDFVTSPEIGPLFGVLVARALDRVWDRLGHPPSFTMVDVGAGPGTLARTVLAAHPRCAEALQLVLVEPSPDQRARHPNGAGIRSVPALPRGPIVGLIVANELLDNLPFDVLTRTPHGWDELRVGHDGTHFGWVAAPGPGTGPVTASPIGAPVPRIEAAARWVDDAHALLAAGELLVFDYGVPTTSEMAGRRWLRTYRAHERGFDPFVHVGEADITTEVPLDQLPTPSGCQRQAHYLAELGLEALVDEGRAAWQAAAAHPDLAALRMRSRIGEAEALTDPGGLGAFWALTWSAG